MKLKPRQFNWDKREWYDNNKSDGSKIQKSPTAGFIAQELDAVQMSANADWLNLVLKDNPNRIEATTGNLLPIIVKAIQDLKKENDGLKAKNENFQAANDKLMDRLSRFEKMQTILVTEIEELRSNNNETTKVSLETK
jgi:septal ring factor EnvC (AmiA/AmiB activator)